jgi:hypothetical protein
MVAVAAVIIEVPALQNASMKYIFDGRKPANCLCRHVRITAGS